MWHPNTQAKGKSTGGVKAGNKSKITVAFLPPCRGALISLPDRES